MIISKKQRFGLITFFILLIFAILVTIEPWKKFTKSATTAIVEAPPSPLSIHWNNLAAGYPGSSVTDTILSYKGFDLAFNEANEQASWVVYILTREEVERGPEALTDNFRPDNSFSTGSAALSDYRGLWKDLEEQVRQWAVEKDSVYVVCGPVLSTIKSSIGENQVGIPGYYFKIIVDLSPPQNGMIAFLLPNEQSDEQLIHYAISVDSLESLTGYNFFEFAPDQEAIEWLEDHPDLFVLK